MGETVRNILADNPAIRPGDVFVTNDPYRGGSHLPDVTVVTPVHELSASASSLLFFTASRAHHAEIGGIVPGSMPPFSRNLAEEGVLIRNFKLMDQGRPRLDELRQLLLEPPVSEPRGGRQPGRHRRASGRQSAGSARPAGDGRAHIRGRSSRPTWATSKAPPSAKCGRRCGSSGDGRYPFADSMDDGSPICVAVTIAGRRGDDRFHRHRAGGAGQLERHAGDRHRGRDVLPALPDRRGHSAQPGRACSGPDRAAGVHAQSAAARRGRRSARRWSAATSRLRSAWSTCSSVPWAWPPPARAR